MNPTKTNFADWIETHPILTAIGFITILAFVYGGARLLAKVIHRKERD